MNISIQSGYGKIPNRKSSVFGTFMQHLINFIIFYVTIITKDLDILIKLCQGKIKKLAKMIYSFNYLRELALSYSLEFVELYKKHSKGFSFFFFLFKQILRLFRLMEHLNLRIWPGCSEMGNRKNTIYTIPGEFLHSFTIC